MFLKLNSIKFGAVTLFGKKEATEGVMVLEISKRYKFDINNNRTDIVEGYNVTVNISEKGGQTIKVDNECKQVIDKIYEEKGANYLLAAIYEAQFDTIDWDHPQVGERYSLFNWSYLNEDLGDIRKYQYENKEIDRMIKVMEAHRKSTHFHE